MPRGLGLWPEASLVNPPKRQASHERTLRPSPGFVSKSETLKQVQVGQTKTHPPHMIHFRPKYSHIFSLTKASRSLFIASFRADTFSTDSDAFSLNSSILVPASVSSIFLKGSLTINFPPLAFGFYKKFVPHIVKLEIKSLFGKGTASYCSAETNLVGGEEILIGASPLPKMETSTNLPG
jgi:hypothetical protein